MSAGYLAKCGAKKRHTNKAGAEGQRWALIRAGKWTASGSNTYGCNVCGGWHAGSKAKHKGGGSPKTKNRNRRQGKRSY